jgi:hypothetical protein
MQTAKEVHSVISRMGVGYNYKGAVMVELAVKFAADEPDSLQLVTKCIYPRVARELGTTPQRVERNIRTVIDTAWRESPELLCRALNRQFRRRPTNAAFISALADRLYLDRSVLQDAVDKVDL